MKRSSTMVLPLLATLSFAYMSWHVAKTTKAVPPIEPPTDPSRAPFSRMLAGAGLIEPKSENIKVGVLVPGVVAEVLVKVGQTVSKGELLFRLDDRQRRADLRIQQAQLQIARQQLGRLQVMPRPEDVPPLEARVRQAQSTLSWEKDQLNRMEGLTARQVATEQELVERKQRHGAAKAEFDVARSDLDRLQAGAWSADVAVMQAQVEQAEQLVLQAQTEVERLEVRSPIDATILKVDVRPGEYVGAPPTQTLIVLGDLSRLHVRVDIDEHDLPRFRAGLVGKAFVRGDAKESLALSFVRIDPYAEPKKSLTGRGDERVDTRVLQAIYAIEPIERAIYVGQQVDVYLEIDPK